MGHRTTAPVVGTAFDRHPRPRASLATVGVAARAVVEQLENRALFAAAAPNDPLFNADGRFTNINALGAWERTTGSADVVVAVIDSGLDITHPDISPNLYVNPGEVPNDGVDNDGNGYVDDVNGWNTDLDSNDVTDNNGHGTHVAGIVGASGNNALGSSGVSQTVKLLPVKFGDDDGSVALEQITRNAIDGLRYATTMKRLWLTSGGTLGANVVAANGSFGVPLQYYDDWATVVNEAADAGILFVVAAGNDSLRNNDGAINYPSNFSLSHPNVITVAATNRDDGLADFSSVAPTGVHVAAPGVDITSTWPLALDADGYNTISGTSMASPVVAGIIALEAAANPRATAQQLKQALIDGVDVIPSLDRPNSLPRQVLTGGRVNADKAVLNVLSYLRKTDAVTQGGWQGNYGGVAYDIPGGGASTTGNVAVSVNGAEIVQTRPGKKPAALTSPVDPAAKVGTYYRAGQTIDVLFNPDTTEDFDDPASLGADGVKAGPHRVSLYFAELKGSKRAVNVELVDLGDDLTNPADDQVLSTKRFAGFAKGTYVTYDVTGPAMFRITRAAGKDVVLNGVFVDAPFTAGQTPAFLGEDRATGGNWKAAYDADGAYLVGYADQLSKYASIGTGNLDVVTLAASTTRKGALLFEGQTKRGVAAYMRTADVGTISLTFNDTGSHQVTVYAADLEKKKRAQRFDLLDANGAVIDSREVTDFKGGVYLTWNVIGNATIRFTKLRGPDAVVNAVFVDQVVGESGHYVGRDSTTNGQWRGTYGVDAQFLVGDRDASVEPAREFVFPHTGGLTNVLSMNSRLPGAVQRYVGTGPRVAAQIESRDTITFTLDIPTYGEVAGAQTQRVSFYAADFQKKKYAQQIQVFNANGVLIAETDMVAFNKGQYASFDLSGTVTVKVNNLSDNSDRAVLSAIYFD